MISILVDEAYAFDVLSILSIKQYNSDIDYLNYDNCLNLISMQIGKNKFNEIYDSDEYSNLLEDNRAIYDLIECIRLGDKIDAKEVDDLNMLRYKHKKQLQEKYFNSGLTEKKTK